MRISDWSSDVCSSDLRCLVVLGDLAELVADHLQGVVGQASLAEAALGEMSGDGHAQGIAVAGEPAYRRRCQRRELGIAHAEIAGPQHPDPAERDAAGEERESGVSGKRVSVGVYLGGRCCNNKKT